MPKRRSAVSGQGGRTSGGAGVLASAGAAAAGGGVSGSGGSGGFAPFTVVTEEYSATRDRYEWMRTEVVRPGYARVTTPGNERSGAPAFYEVHYGENPSCTCPDFTRRRHPPGYLCRHIIGARRAAGIAVSQEEVEAARPRVPLTQRAAFDASQAAHEMAEQRAEASSVPAPPVGEHEISLEDDESFRALFERALREDIPYEYENVLGGSNNTFGVEIEFVGGDRNAIARELYQRGLIPEPRQRSYHSTRSPGMWSFETDGSVDGEIVSPVFRDTPEAWRQIEEVCEVIRRHGGTSVSSTRSIGFHVHIGNVPLDHDNVRFQNLINLWRSNEDLFYRIGAGGESRGRHRGTRYALPLGGRGNVNISSHYSVINQRTQTIEFRVFNGTLDPKQIQANVKLANALVEAAGRMREPVRVQELGNASYGSITGERVHQEEQNHGAIRRLLDRIFTRVNDKMSVLWLYATSRWQRATT